MSSGASSRELVPLTIATAGIAALLHARAGLHPAWDERAFIDLLTMPGCAGSIAVADEPAGLVLWRVAADEAEIITLCVSAAWRRCGLGRALLDGAASAVLSQGAATLFLEVAIDNHGAIGLYRKAGFLPAGRRAGYYETADGAVDALVMARRLI